MVLVIYGQDNVKWLTTWPESIFGPVARLDAVALGVNNLLPDVCQVNFVQAAVNFAATFSSYICYAQKFSLL